MRVIAEGQVRWSNTIWGTSSTRDSWALTTDGMYYVIFLSLALPAFIAPLSTIGNDLGAQQSQRVAKVRRRVHVHLVGVDHVRHLQRRCLYALDQSFE